MNESLVRRPLGAYRQLSWRRRAHVAGRWLTGPFGVLEGTLPTGGRVLDWGCGHGLLAVWAAVLDGDRTVEGVDIDAAKLEAARSAAGVAGCGDRVAFRQVDPHAVPEGSWDGVVCNDVLYLMAPDQQERVVRAAARALAPSGVVVCKELGTRPRWKRRLLRLQEQVAVGVVRLTATGDGLQAFPDPEVVAGWLRSEGLETEVLAIDRGYHAPHVAVVGCRPA